MDSQDQTLLVQQAEQTQALLQEQAVLEQQDQQQEQDDCNTPVEVTGAFRVLSEEELAGLTKSARRRYEKDLRFHEFKAKRLEKRALERQRAKEKRKERAAAGLPARPPKIKHDRVPTGVRVVIDLDFPGHMMQLKDTKSLCKQVSFCYAANRQHAVSVDLMATGMSSALEDVLKSQYPTFRNWDKFPIYQQGYMDMLGTNDDSTSEPPTNPPAPAAEPSTPSPGPKPLPPPPSIPKSSLVYLTGDSPNVLTSLEPGKTYIIGGLVDHNQFKKLCLNRAEEQGIAHAQLPIGDHIKLNSRRVLAVNHCFEIMIKVLENGGDWPRALNDVMPERKVGDQPKERKKKKGNRVSNRDDAASADASSQARSEEDQDGQSLGEGEEDQVKGGIKRPRSPSPGGASDAEHASGSDGDRPSEKRAKTDLGGDE